MGHYEPETEKKIERSDMSVDQILDEYWARVAEEARRAQEQREYEALAARQSEAPVRILDEDDTDEDGVRIYRPGVQASAPRSWRGEGDFDLVYESGEAADGDYDDEDDWYEEDEEEFRPMSARDILREYWTANAPSYKVELPEEQPAPPPAPEPEEEEYDEDEDVAIYTPMSVRDILKEYWEDNAPSYIDVPEPEPERKAEPEGQSLEEAVSGAAGESLRPVAAIFGLREDEQSAAAEAAAEPEAPQAEAEEELPPPALKDILAEYWAMASELPPAEAEAETEAAAEAVETAEAGGEAEAEEAEAEAEPEAFETEAEGPEAEADGAEEAPAEEAESAEAVQSLSEILAEASLWEKLPEDEEPVAVPEGEAADEAEEPDAEPEAAPEELRLPGDMSEGEPVDMAVLAGLFAGLGKRRAPETAPEPEAEEEAEAEPPEEPEEELPDRVTEDEIPDGEAPEAAPEDQVLPEVEPAAEEEPLDEIDEIIEDAPAEEAEPEASEAELPEAEESEEAGDFPDAEIPDPARSYEDLRELLTEVPEGPAPTAEPEARSAENAGGYVYGEKPEPTVREILAEYWTSGESEPIQDAQMRAEADAAQAEREQAAQQRPLEQAEVTVYQPVPEEQAPYAAPSVEDYQHTAEDLGLTVDSILADYWANIAPRPAAYAAPAEPETAEPEVAAEEEAYEPEPERPAPAERRRVKVRPAAAGPDGLADLSAHLGTAAVGAGAAAGAAAAAGEAGRSSLSAMADEARRFIAQMEDSGYAGLKEEADYAAGAKGPYERRFDPRFDIGGARRTQQTMTFDGKEVDLSADENYVPPSAESVDLPTQWRGEDEEEEAPVRPEPKWLGALRNWGVQKKPKKRALNAPRTDYDPYGLDALAAAAARGEEAPEDGDAAGPAAEPDLSGADAAEIFARTELEKPRSGTTVTAEELEAAADFFRPAGRRGDESGTGDTPGSSGYAQAVRIEDEEAAPADYAPYRDYDEAELDEVELEDFDPDDDSFPSFGQWLLSLLTGSLIRIRGVGDPNSAETMEDDDEELGPEVPAAAASKYYGSHVRTLRLRFRIGLVLLAILAWITLGLPVTGMLKTARVAAGMCLVLQLTIMLLCLDVVTNAAINLARARFGADCLSVLACVLTSIDALAVAIGGFGHSHTPLCLLSSLSLLGVLYSALLSARGLRKALRVPAIGKRCYAVTGERGVKGKDVTLLKSVRPSAGFVRRCEEAPPDESLFVKLSPFLLLAALLLTAATVLVKKSASDFLYVLTAILCPAVPVTALLSFALPYCMGAMRIFSSGAAIAGWSGVSDVGRSENLIVTDRDLFPEGSVDLESVRIFADAPAEKIISYAGSMITASGSGIANCFGDLMRRNGGVMRRVENFEYLPGGGMKGIIHGETVLCGSTDLMRLMNVRIPYRLVSRTSVLLAIDGVLYGIFNMSYTPLPQVRAALVGLIRSSRHPIFAIRDFNISPETLHSIFDVATDGYDFPPYMERFAISEAKPAKESRIAAVVCREGLGPLVHMADTGRSLFTATRINLLVAVLAAAVNLLAVFVTLLSGGYVSALFLLALMLVWILPVAVVSLFLRF